MREFERKREGTKGGIEGETEGGGRERWRKGWRQADDGERGREIKEIKREGGILRDRRRERRSECFCE